MTIAEIVEALVTARNLEIDPANPADITSPFDAKPAIDIIQKHIDLNNKIFIYGDYDVDGICATAILWETLYANYKNVFPHIPHRESEGYGLSIKGIDHCLAQGAKLIIAVDNGIVAFEQIAYCKKLGVDIIVIDHHELDKKMPIADAIVHSTACCAAGLSWFFARDLQGKPNAEHLSLAATATICDMVPLTGINRSIAKFGIVQLNKTQRPGVLELLKVAGVENKKINTYAIGFLIGPRINSMGRLEHAIDSLRLLCTHDRQKAVELAQLLNDTNKQRQEETDSSILHAKENVNQTGIMLAADVSYHPGVIGLIAARLLEAYTRPAIAVSIGEEFSKGSGRSLPGFNITEFLRQHQELFTALGGHAGACGFTIETAKLDQLAQLVQSVQLDSEILVKKQRVDLEIPLELVSLDLWDALQDLEPFGLGNPQPIFKSLVEVVSSRVVGQTKKHSALKFTNGLEGIWFNHNEEIKTGKYAAFYSLDRDLWNGQERLKLMVKNLT